MISSSGTCACDESSPLVVLCYSIGSGFLVGFGLVIAWVYWMIRRSKGRAQMVSKVELLNRISDQQCLSKLFGGSVPSHISFPEYEKVRWLNKVLVELWPFVVEATGERAKMELQPMLEKYIPPWIINATLASFHIGNVPPRIEGVKILSLPESRQVQMDLDFKWSGDGSIILRVTPDWSKLTLPSGATLPTELEPDIELSMMSFNATIRVIFQLADEIPCISALVVTLLQEPRFKIDYTLSKIGIIPVIGDSIKDMVNICVADQVEWPHRKVFPIGDTPADIISDLGSKLHGQLRVTVVRAEGLPDKNIVCGKTNRYVQLFVRELFKKKTKNNPGMTRPQWGEEFDLNVEDPEAQTLVLQVMTYSEFVLSEELGRAAVSLRNLEPDTEYEITQPLRGSSGTTDDNLGKITIKLLYHHYTLDERKDAMEVEKEDQAASGGTFMNAFRNSRGGSEGSLTRSISKHVGTGVTSIPKILAAAAGAAEVMVSPRARRKSGLPKHMNTPSTSNDLRR